MNIEWLYFFFVINLVAISAAFAGGFWIGYLVAALGGGVVAGELWWPGKTVISIPKARPFGDVFLDDWVVRPNGDIRYVGATGSKGTYTTVLDLHRALTELSYRPCQEGLCIIDPTPSARITDDHIELAKGLNIDDSSAEHLYGGTIVQRMGNTMWSSLGWYKG